MNYPHLTHVRQLPMNVFLSLALVVAAAGWPAFGAAPLPLTNHKSGISVSLSGGNGADWAVEMTYHDEEIADQILYVKSSVNFSLAHNANNTLEIDSASKLPHVLGTTVPEGRAERRRNPLQD